MSQNLILFLQNSLQKKPQRMKYGHQENINKETKIDRDELDCSLTICKQKEELIYKQSF